MRELAILLNNPKVRRASDQAISKHREGHESLSPELTAFIILAVILAAGICIWITS